MVLGLVMTLCGLAMEEVRSWFTIFVFSSCVLTVFKFCVQMLKCVLSGFCKAVCFSLIASCTAAICRFFL